MTPTTWNALEDTHPAEYREKYLEWIYDPANIGNCRECPHNCGHDGHEANGHPCGQQNCWVAVHVAAARR